MLRNSLFSAVTLVLFCLHGLVPAVERTWPGLGTGTTFSSGLEYIEGDYGTGDTTRLWRVPFIYAVRHGQYGFSVETALLSAESDGAIVINNKMSDRRSTGGTNQQSVSGIGDIWLTGNYYFAETVQQSYRVTALLKLGTASESDGLGTGENDIAIEGATSRRIDKYTLALMLGYEINGDSPLYNYDDYLYGRIGLSTRLPERRIAGASVYLAESAVAGGEDPIEVTAYLRQPVSRIGKADELYFYVTLGLSDGSPDTALGALLQFRL